MYRYYAVFYSAGDDIKSQLSCNKVTKLLEQLDSYSYAYFIYHSSFDFTLPFTVTLFIFSHLGCVFDKFLFT